jgi:hypothetical protein
VVISSLTSLLFHEGYTSIEKRKDYFSHWCVVYKEKKDVNFVRKLLKEKEEE